jgi:hypothetical protein
MTRNAWPYHGGRKRRVCIPYCNGGRCHHFSRAEISAIAAVKRAEKDALRAMRNLADFNELCRFSEALFTADRTLRRVRRAKVK